MTKRQTEQRNMLIKYTLGFLISLTLTLTAYVLVSGQAFSGTALVIILGGLALIQMLVQLVFFLHVSDESRPRFRLLSFSFMAMVLVIVVGGSLWIMYHLNYNMMGMSSHEKTDYMTTQRDKGF
ncbi:MAG: cyoD [Candidatus Saccharibacteria bacterium]|nr:cyoD [Candidatus Saccharibacteria bacterium]